MLTVAQNTKQDVILPTFQTKLADFNSNVADFGPSFGPDKSIYFASERDTGSYANRRHIIDGKMRPFLQIFHKKDGDSIRPVMWGSPINKRFHESTPVFSPDGESMYFTRNNFNKGKTNKSKNGRILLKIFKSKLQDDKTWGVPEEVSFNSNEYSVGHPAISPDGKWMYFASNMPGTLGKSDIYKVKINEDGSFGTPENMGSTINTSESDSFPAVDKEGNLYFASNGHKGEGGLDLFLSVFETKFNAVYNLGSTINTSSDDFAMIIDTNDGTGYFSSNREGGLGDDDIYELTQLTPLIIPCNGTLSGMIRDDITFEPLPNATVVIVDEDGKEIAMVTSDEAGYYNVDIDCNKEKFIATARKDKYLPKSKEVSPTRIVPNIMEGFDLTLTKIEVGEDLAKELNIKPIYFDINKSVIREDATLELNKVIEYMKRYPDVNIEIRSHSDSRGGDKYNLVLSDKRAKASAKYISEVGGIDPSRISGKGYGETQLLNKCDDGVKCSEDEHQLNRRSEFISVQK